MRALYQIVCYTVTLLIALFFGSVFHIALWQVSVFWIKHILGNKPLPAFSDSLIRNYDLPFYFFVIPWLLFAAAPLLSLKATRNYWDSSDFFLRLVSFLLITLLMFSIFLLAIALPFIPMVGAMYESHGSTVEFAFCWLFWILICLTVAGVVIRIIQLRRN
jgi:hypothetical protein